MRQSLPLMHFYSGKLLQFYSGVDTEDDDEEFAADDEPEQAYIVRRFAQPLGIHLDSWEERIIQTKKGVVRLLPVTERAIQLFGEAGADAMASAIEHDPRKAAQLELFPAVDADMPKIKGKGRKKTAGTPTVYASQVTTLDRVHAAMLLQPQGRTNALRSLLTAEAERGPDFLRLANALSALYSQANEEKRLLDAIPASN
jgi:putative DNA methylase